MTKTVFSATDATGGHDIWITDGTGAGTSLLHSFSTTLQPVWPEYLAATGLGTVLFNANDGTSGGELWVTDGTVAGTSLLKDIYPGGSGITARNGLPKQTLALAPGRLIFAATTAAAGRELWVTDGTAAGTSMLRDINNGSASAFPARFALLGGGKAIFAAADSTSGMELWSTDGTSAGTTQVKDIFPGATGSNIQSQAALGDGRVIFSATDPTNGQELWVTDGTPGGTTLVKDIAAGTNNSNVFYPVALSTGHAVFQANDQVHGAELWVTDGTTAGTSMVLDINASVVGAASSPKLFTALGDGRVLFQANDGTHGTEAWVTDGTAAGTSLLADANPGSANGAAQSFAVTTTGHAVFVATDASHGAELWVTNGTAAGTSLLKDINPGATGGSINPTFSVGDGRVLFTANDGVNGSALWVTDGTSAGTSMISAAAAPSLMTNALAIPCFAGGTRILTLAGERPVEAIAVGMVLPTASGRLRRVVWTGQARVDLARHPAPARAAPIRVAAGAFGPGLPARDLLLSPDHAIAVGGGLIPARLLVNGTTIRQDFSLAAIGYHHIELDAHDVLIAEGLPCESFLDTGNRGQLGEGARPLHPDFSQRAWDERACLPLLLGGPAVAAARAAIAACGAGQMVARAG